MCDVDAIHDTILRNLLKSSILSNHLKKHNNLKDYYVALIGGTSLSRCMTLNNETKQLLGGEFLNDIDLKFIIVNKVSSNEDAIVKKVHKKQTMMINALTKDKELKKLIKYSLGGEDIVVKIEKHDLLSSVHERARLNLVVSINLEYFGPSPPYGQNEKMICRKTLIDTSVFNSFNNAETFDSYKSKFAPHSKLPVPIVIRNGIPYGTCGWVFYDTVRMLVESVDQYENAGTNIERNFHFMKLIKYISKFAIMYIFVHKIKTIDDLGTLKRSYKRAKGLLQKLNIKDPEINAIISKKHVIIKDILSELCGKTDIVKLSKLLLKGDKHFSLLDDRAL